MLLMVIILIINCASLASDNLYKVLYLFFLLTLVSNVISILQFAQFKPALVLHDFLYPDNVAYESFDLKTLSEKNYSFYVYLLQTKDKKRLQIDEFVPF